MFTELRSFYYDLKMNDKIVLFSSIRNCKSRNIGNFTPKLNSIIIMLFGGRGQHYLVINKISTLLFIFLGLFTISK